MENDAWPMDPNKVPGTRRASPDGQRAVFGCLTETCIKRSKAWSETCCSSASPQEPGCEWIDASGVRSSFSQPYYWPERHVGDPTRPDPAVLIKQLIPQRRQSSAEGHLGTYSYSSLLALLETAWTAPHTARLCGGHGDEAMSYSKMSESAVVRMPCAGYRHALHIEFVPCAFWLMRGAACRGATVKSRIFRS